MAVDFVDHMEKMQTLYMKIAPKKKKVAYFEE